MIDWAKNWLNKYDKKLMKLVVVVAVIAKEKRKNKHVARKFTIRRNVQKIQKNFCRFISLRYRYNLIQLSVASMLLNWVSEKGTISSN
jgi:hypothetical protein